MLYSLERTSPSTQVTFWNIEYWVGMRASRSSCSTPSEAISSYFMPMLVMVMGVVFSGGVAFASPRTYLDVPSLSDHRDSLVAIVVVHSTSEFLVLSKLSSPLVPLSNVSGWLFSMLKMPNVRTQVIHVSAIHSKAFLCLDNSIGVILSLLSYLII